MLPELDQEEIAQDLRAQAAIQPDSGLDLRFSDRAQGIGRWGKAKSADDWSPGCINPDRNQY